MSADTTTTVFELAGEVARTTVAGHQHPVSAGFDSIAVIELAVRLEESLGVVCTIEDVFDAPSFDALAAELTTRVERAGR
jgi:acyl carrier protein